MLLSVFFLIFSYVCTAKTKDDLLGELQLLPRLFYYFVMHVSCYFHYTIIVCKYFTVCSQWFQFIQYLMTLFGSLISLVR